MGAVCVHNCEHAANVIFTQPDNAQASITPGLSSSSVPGSSTDVKTGATFGSPLEAISGIGRMPSQVPVLNSLKWLQQSDGADVKKIIANEGAWFDEMTPRKDATPGASPRDSPRPPDEGRLDTSDPAEISYEGARLNGLKHGYGHLRTDGSSYDGEFFEDEKHGVGEMTWDDGRRYRGHFKNGKFHGAAVVSWSDGRMYAGEYADDRKHGEGTFSWHDGRRYQGQWVMGKRHGIGVYTNAKLVTRTGIWEMDRPLRWETFPVNPWAQSRAQDSDDADVSAMAPSGTKSDNPEAMLQCV